MLKETSMGPRSLPGSHATVARKRGGSLRWPTVSAILCSLLLVAFAGCQQGPPQVAPAEPPTVPVSRPVEREVTDFVDFTGRTDAVEAVNVVPRVTGYLVQIA